MLYFSVVPNEILEIIISNVNYQSFINLLSLINVINLNYNHIVNLRYPKLRNKKKG
jgi:hypothetical protein